MYYSEYIRNTISPCGLSTFNSRIKRGKTLEEMIILDYLRVYKYKKAEYSIYCLWCFNNKFAPKSKSQFNLTPLLIYQKPHAPINLYDFSQYDKEYMSGLHLFHTERKGNINQYFCLFYKLYFQRKKRAEAL